MTNKLKSFSATPGSNTAAPPFGWPEGMSPSAVNDTARQDRASLREWYEDAEWRDLGHSVVIVSGQVITVSGSLLAFYGAGRAIRVNGSFVGTITASALATGNTAVTVDGFTPPASITQIELGLTLDTVRQIVRGTSGLSFAAANGALNAAVNGANRLSINTAGRTLIGPTLPTDDGTSALQATGTSRLGSSATSSCLLGEGQYGGFQQLIVAADQTIQIAGGGAINGTFMIRVSGSNREQFVVVNANGQNFGTNTLSVLANHSFSGGAILTNFRIDASADNALRYLVCDVGNRNAASVTVQVTAIGPVPRLSPSLTPGGSTASTTLTSIFTGITGNVLLNSQTDDGAKLQVNGSQSFQGVGRRITGDMTNAAASSRLMFQSSTLNGFTDLSAIPNGTSTIGAVSAYNDSAPDNASYAQIQANATAIDVISGRQGAGALLPMRFTVNSAVRLTLDTAGLATFAGDVAVNGGDLSSSATTFNLLNATATTVNLAGAATALTVGATSGTMTLRNPTIVGVSTTQALFNTVATTLNIGGAANSILMGASGATLTFGALPAYLARAWVNFNGATATVLAGGNVSSVVRNSAGLFTVNFTAALADANYAWSGSARDDTTNGDVTIGQGSAYTKTASALQIRTWDAGNNFVDSTNVSVTVHR